jgi:hypothetical protein
MIALPLVCAAAWPVIEVSARPLDIPGPPGSHAFGTAVAVLQNGNFVVTDPYAQNGAMNVGAVYLYRPDGPLIDFFSGSTAGIEANAAQTVLLLARALWICGIRATCC